MLKKLFLLFITTGLLLPFVLLTDLYPFFRLGMFAEPIQHTTQTEYFIVEYRPSPKQPFQRFSTAVLGFEDSHFQYIVRYYVYQQQTTRLLQILHQKQKKQLPLNCSWQIKRILVHHSKFLKDTVLLLHWQPTLPRNK